MTREEAIEMLKKDKEQRGDCFISDAIDMAIQALEQESSYNSVNSLAESKLKNPKANTFDILHFVADNAGLSTFEAIEKAYNMGVSEQERVLDKIRQIIRHWNDTGCSAEEANILNEIEEVMKDDKD